MVKPAVEPQPGAPWRYERKIVVRDLDPRMVEASIRRHPAHFGEIFGQRYVNNCYFDSPALLLLRDAVQGHSQRLKVRVRWYGDLFGPVSRPVLELKRKQGMVGSKEGYRLPAFVMDRNRVLPELEGWFGEAPWPAEIPGEYRSLRPALINRYSRRYFATPDRRFRLTLDTGCEYYAAAPGRVQAAPHARDHVTTVIELKYAVAEDVAAAAITDALPFRITKNSKYVNGMLRVGRA